MRSPRRSRSGTVTSPERDEAARCVPARLHAARESRSAYPRRSAQPGRRRVRLGGRCVRRACAFRNRFAYRRASRCSQPARHRRARIVNDGRSRVQVVLQRVHKKVALYRGFRRVLTQFTGLLRGGLRRAPATGHDASQKATKPPGFTPSASVSTRIRSASVLAASPQPLRRRTSFRCFFKTPLDFHRSSPRSMHRELLAARPSSLPPT